VVGSFYNILATGKGSRPHIPSPNTKKDLKGRACQPECHPLRHLSSVCLVAKAD